jgi:hypothetical protein
MAQCCRFGLVFANRSSSMTIQVRSHHERRITMPVQVYFVNVPYNCSDCELREWIESRGIETASIRLFATLYLAFHRHLLMLL